MAAAAPAAGAADHRAEGHKVRVGLEMRLAGLTDWQEATQVLRAPVRHRGTQVAREAGVASGLRGCRQRPIHNILQNMQESDS